MGKRLAIATGGIGSVLGLLIGFVLDMATPDGFSCLNFSATPASNVTTLGASLTAMILCWEISIVCAAVVGAFGSVIGLIISES